MAAVVLVCVMHSVCVCALLHDAVLQKINVQVTSLLASAQGWPTLHTYNDTMNQFVSTLADSNIANDVIAAASDGTIGPSTQESVSTSSELLAHDNLFP
jgi:hypothetical protein